jgi:hypothetical protein
VLSTLLLLAEVEVLAVLVALVEGEVEVLVDFVQAQVCL